MVFFLKGKNVFSKYHPITRSISANGVITIIQSPKPNPMLSPFGSFRYFIAMAFGGVPIIVPMPPIFAATGMARVSATRPLPSGGRALNTGVRNVSIIAAVAVLLTNMENIPVMSTKPNNTFSLFVPNGFNSVRASKTSSPDFVAAMARMNPPKNSIIIGSANVAISAL